jgi:molybdate transport system substrate-binding protein
LKSDGAMAGYGRAPKQSPHVIAGNQTKNESEDLHEAAEVMAWKADRRTTQRALNEGELMMTRILLAAALTTGFVQVADAAEIKALFPVTLGPTADQVIPQFEKSSGHKVTITYGTAGAVTASVRRGDPTDVAITAAPQIEDLERQGKIVGGGVILAKVGIGVFVRKGAPRPDISSANALKTSLLAATIVYTDPAAGGPVGIYVAKLLDQLGIGTAMKPKTKLTKGGEANQTAVVNGESEIGFNMINEILIDPRVDLVGPLPPPIQDYTTFAAGIIATSTEQGAGRALIGFLSSPDTFAVMRKLGFEPG